MQTTYLRQWGAENWAVEGERLSFLYRFMRNLILVLDVRSSNDSDLKVCFRSSSWVGCLATVDCCIFQRSRLYHKSSIRFYHVSFCVASNGNSSSEPGYCSCWGSIHVTTKLNTISDNSSVVELGVRQDDWRLLDNDVCVHVTGSSLIGDYAIVVSSILLLSFIDTQSSEVVNCKLLSIQVKIDSVLLPRANDFWNSSCSARNLNSESFNDIESSRSFRDDLRLLMNLKNC